MLVEEERFHLWTVHNQ